MISTLLLALAVAEPGIDLPPADISPFPSFEELDGLTSGRAPELGITATPFTFVLTDPSAHPDVFPSMEQSLGLYEAYAVGTNELLRRAFAAADNPWLEWGVGVPLTGIANFVLDASMRTPFGAPHAGWLHEEWHRAVMSSHGIDTFSSLAVPGKQLEAALGPRFHDASFGSVVGMSDNQAAAFKEARPGDYVRMSTAGMESQTEAIRRIERDQFFYFAENEVWGPLRSVRGWNAGTLLLNAVNVYGYIATCGSKGSVKRTEDDQAGEGKDPLARDFTGLDCDAAYYDLFRPREPYEARGTHPSGIGVDRYRHLDDLNAAEAQYAHDTALRALLVFADPALLNLAGLRFADVIGERDLKVTGRLNHMLTPIGSAVELEALAQLRPFNVAAVVRATALLEGVVPSLDLALVRLPFVLRVPAAADPAVRAALAPWVDPTVVTVSLDARTWIEPHDLVATEDDLRLGGLMRVDVGVQMLPSVELVLSGMAKSEGFAAGVLQTGAGGGAGVALRTWLY